MSNFRQKLNEALYLSVDRYAGVRGIMLVYTSLVCDPPFLFFFFVLCGVFFSIPTVFTTDGDYYVCSDQ